MGGRLSRRGERGRCSESVAAMGADSTRRGEGVGANAEEPASFSSHVKSAA